MQTSQTVSREDHRVFQAPDLFLSVCDAAYLNVIRKKYNMSITPNFKNYSFDELEEVEQNIDKELHPDRYEVVLNELTYRRSLEANSKPTIKEQDNKAENPPSKNKRISWLVISLFLGIYWLTEGEITAKNNNITPEGEPIIYWFFILMVLGNTVYNLVVLMKMNYAKNK